MRTLRLTPPMNTNIESHLTGKSEVQAAKVFFKTRTRFQLRALRKALSQVDKGPKAILGETSVRTFGLAQEVEKGP
jgi:hypothetical protein